MNGKIVDLLGELNEAKEIIIGTVDRYSDDEQRKSPNGTGWSMNQVIEHLVISEAGILKFFQKYNPYETSRKTSWKYSLKSISLNLWLNSPFKASIPDDGLAPSGETDFETLVTQWGLVRDDLEEIIINFPKDKMGFTVFKHPLAGPLTMAQTLKFMSLHIRRHTKQVLKIGNGKLSEN